MKQYLKRTESRGRNGYTKKTLKTTYKPVEINSPRDRDGSFEPAIVPKRETDVSEIDHKVLAMYARGISQRDILKQLKTSMDLKYHMK